MNSTTTASPAQIVSGPVGGIGRSVLAIMGYAGGVTLMATAALGSILWPVGSRDQAQRLDF